MERIVWAIVVIAAVVALIVGGYVLWFQRPAEVAVAPSPPSVTPPPAAPEAPPAPAIAHPIEPDASPERGPLPALEASDAYASSALAALLGRADVTRFLQIDGFVRRAVATIDNLGRSHAAPRLWPVVPTPGRFNVERTSTASVIGSGNAARYAPFVHLVEAIDARKAAAAYREAYPLFQRAYEELGYSGRYFNDRLVEVIDQLVRTPEPSEPIAVELTEVKGAQDPRPWVRYDYADPALRSLSAGQKMLVRMGPTHARTLKAKLRELRTQIAQAPPSASPAR